jgi:hypothetical protein
MSHDIDSQHCQPYKLSLVFTGHMIDAPGRIPPRFPPEMEHRAADAIRAQVRSALRASGGSLVGFASGARGGDILFHEVCLAERVPTHLVLPFEPQRFLKRSVLGARTGDWGKRFKSLWRRLSQTHRHVLEGEGPDPFGACNDAMFMMAQEQGESVELLALWDGAGAAKPGGTAAFAERVRKSGGKVCQINTQILFDSFLRRR